MHFKRPWKFGQVGNKSYAFPNNYYQASWQYSTEQSFFSEMFVTLGKATKWHLQRIYKVNIL